MFIKKKDSFFTLVIKLDQKILTFFINICVTTKFRRVWQLKNCCCIFMALYEDMTLNLTLNTNLLIVQFYFNLFLCYELLIK